MQNPDEWVQFYQNTATCVDADNIMSPSNPSSHQLSPSKACGLKPIRRRSRASKKTPVTLLNANASNFRALVQQFTGCPTTATCFARCKGPVNLSFERASEDGYYNADSVKASVGFSCCGQENQIMFNGQQEQKQLQILNRQVQSQEWDYPLNNVDKTAFFQTTSDQSMSREEFAEEGFGIEDVKFDELIEDSLLSELGSDSHFL